MPDQELVSIIIRSQGRRLPLLRHALNSLTAQTYRPLEIILVEDGGNKLASLLGEFAVNGLQVSHHPIPPSGRSAAGNAGLKAARGVFAGFLDDDDELLPSHVAVLASILAQHPEAAGCYAGALEVLVDDGDHKSLAGRSGRLVFQKPFVRLALWHSNIMPIQAVLFRRQVFLDQGGFDETLDALEDWDLWLRYAVWGSFIPVSKTTSAFRMPYSPKAVDRRKESHTQARARIFEKYRGVTITVGMEDVAAFADSMTQTFLHHASIRAALARQWRRCIAMIRNLP